MGDSYINFTIWTRGLQLVLSRVSLGLVIMVLGGGGLCKLNYLHLQRKMPGLREARGLRGRPSVVRRRF